MSTATKAARKQQQLKPLSKSTHYDSDNASDTIEDDDDEQVFNKPKKHTTILDDDIDEEEDEHEKSEEEEDDEDTLPKRGQRWTLSDSLILVEAVEEFGKGSWERVMEYCHDRHLCVRATDPAKFRAHFNYLNNDKRSSYFKPYKRPTFASPSGKNISKKIIQKAEREFDLKHQRIESDRERVRDILLRIREREKLSTTKKRKTRKEVGKMLLEAGEERRKAKTAKYADFKEQAESEKAYRNESLEVAKGLQKAIDKTTATEERLLGMMEQWLDLEMRRYEWQMFEKENH